MEYIKRLLFIALLFPALLVAAHPDTLWVARRKADRVALMAFAPGWSVAYSGGRMTVTGQAVVRDSTSAVALLESRARLIGADTTVVELRYTTADTLPSEWPGEWILNAEGYFEAK